MKSNFIPGPLVIVDGIEYYELIGYGIEGRLLLSKEMVENVPLDKYDEFIEDEIDRALKNQLARKINGRGRDDT